MLKRTSRRDLPPLPTEVRTWFAYRAYLADELTAELWSAFMELTLGSFRELGHEPTHLARSTPERPSNRYVRFTEKNLAKVVDEITGSTRPQRFEIETFPEKWWSAFHSSRCSIGMSAPPRGLTPIADFCTDRYELTDGLRGGLVAELESLLPVRGSVGACVESVTTGTTWLSGMSNGFVSGRLLWERGEVPEKDLAFMRAGLPGHGYGPKADL